LSKDGIVTFIISSVNDVFFKKFNFCIHYGRIHYLF
jgi:hypothetical protein